MLRVYIGWDSREQEAFRVAERTAREFGCDVIPLYEDRLRSSGMLTRPTDRRGNMIWDFNSNAAGSTEFHVARFFVPLLTHSGWSLFVDADVVFMDDPHELLKYCDERKAVHVVKHPPFNVSGRKMDDQVQTSYPRKLWSSICLWNASHPANARLNLTTLNQWPGRDLHAFKWLADDEIGDLPPEANWLVNMQPQPDHPMVAHFTQGGPWLPNWKPAQHDELWLRASER